MYANKNVYWLVVRMYMHTISNKRRRRKKKKIYDVFYPRHVWPLLWTRNCHLNRPGRRAESFNLLLLITWSLPNEIDNGANKLLASTRQPLLPPRMGVYPPSIDSRLWFFIYLFFFFLLLKDTFWLRVYALTCNREMYDYKTVALCCCGFFLFISDYRPYIPSYADWKYYNY